MSFVPRFNYTHLLVKHLGIIEGAKTVIEILPLPPDTTLRLRHDALQRSTRSSTQIEGNPLNDVEVRRAIARGERKGSEAEQEVRNYWFTQYISPASGEPGSGQIIKQSK